MTKSVQPLSQGNNLLPGFIIDTNSTLDMPMVLRCMQKDPLATEQILTGALQSSLRHQASFWFLYCIGDYYGQGRNTIATAATTHGDFIGIRNNAGEILHGMTHIA